jgi:hypothetical protein
VSWSTDGVASLDRARSRCLATAEKPNPAGYQVSTARSPSMAAAK